MNIKHHFTSSNAKAFNIISGLCLVISLVAFVSGKLFILNYDIGSGSTSVIEAALIQISHTRYLIASIFLAISMCVFLGGQLLVTLREISAKVGSSRSEVN
jgi:hypothetical protein